MIDYGLLASLALAVTVPALLAHRWVIASFHPAVGFIDATMGPAAFGLLIGRLSTLALDDPDAFGRLSDVLVIRSGVEFWPAVAAAVALTLWSARRDRVRPMYRLAALVPLAMVGYGTYEAACVVREGCFGPASPVGLRPPGLSTTMLPVGILMGIAVALAAVAVHRFAASGGSPAVTLLAATLSVAGVRAVGSFWLPKVGEALTRPHRTSWVIAAVAALGLAVLRVLRTAPALPVLRR